MPGSLVDWGLRFEFEIGDWDWGFGLGILNWVLGLEMGIGDWDWGLRLGIGIIYFNSTQEQYALTGLHAAATPFC